MFQPVFNSQRNAILHPAGGTFNPLALLPSFWLEADSNANTLSQTGFAGSGTVTQVGTAITGVGTSFLTQVFVGDALSGTLISGNVTVVTDDTHCTVNASNSGAGAAYTITPRAGVNDAVTTILDAGTNAYAVTQATIKNAPRKYPSVVNGNPALRFRGAQYAPFPAGALGLFNNVASATIVLVASPATVAAGNLNIYTVSSGNSAGNVRVSLSANQSAGKFRLGARRLDADTAAVTNGALSLLVGTFYIFVAQYTWSAATLKGYINGGTADISNASFQTTGNTDTTNSLNMNIGSLQVSSQPWNGDVSVLGAFVPALSLANINLLGAYLGTKYGLTWTTAV